jgi:hypothetical protein
LRGDSLAAGRVNPKHESRNPKSEIRNKFKVRNPKSKQVKPLIDADETLMKESKSGPTRFEVPTPFH